HVCDNFHSLGFTGRPPPFPKTPAGARERCYETQSNQGAEDPIGSASVFNRLQRHGLVAEWILLPGLLSPFQGVVDQAHARILPSNSRMARPTRRWSMPSRRSTYPARRHLSQTALISR